jgi:hypothetical protein
MKTWAKLNEENQVVDLTKVSDNIEDAKLWLETHIGGTWIQTFDEQDVENGEDQKRYFNPAGIGDFWDEQREAFVPAQPYPSWTLDETIMNWVAPVAKTGDASLWDEENQTWVEA